MSGTWANNDKVREALGIRKVSLGCRHVAQSLVLNTPFMLESSNSSQRLCYHALELINNLPGMIPARLTGNLSSFSLFISDKGNCCSLWIARCTYSLSLCFLIS
jgi:hypothetical protein